MLSKKVILSFGLLVAFVHESKEPHVPVPDKSTSNSIKTPANLVKFPPGPAELRTGSMESESEPGPGLISEYADVLKTIFTDFQKFYQSGCIYPGTKYCGKGSTANKDGRLGSRKYADKCCYAHDSCDDIIPAGGEKYGLKNQNEFALLHCKCDTAFLQCLKYNIQHGQNVKTSTGIGTIYFNRPQTAKCYRLDHPIRGCLETSSILDRCIKYDLDKTQEMQWQFFDLPPFDLMYTYYSYTDRLPEWGNCIIL